MSLVMPILPGETRVRVYTASAGQTQFAASFPFQANADILVQYTLAGETALTDLVEGDDYTLTGAGTASGGILTLVTPAAAGDKVTITGKAVLSRVSSVVQAGVFRSITLDEEFDRNRIIQQEFARDIDRQLLVPPGSTGGTIFMPDEPDRYLLTDGNGNLVDGGSAEDIGAAQANAAAAAAAAVSAAEAAAAALSIASGLGSVSTFAFSLAELRAVNTSQFKHVYLCRVGRTGEFVWRQGDYSADVASDTSEGIFVKANSVSASSGCWVRADDGRLNVRWFGARGTGTDDDTVAINACYTQAHRLRRDVRFPAGIYAVRESGTGTGRCITINSTSTYGDGAHCTWIVPHSTGVATDVDFIRWIPLADGFNDFLAFEGLSIWPAYPNFSTSVQGRLPLWFVTDFEGINVSKLSLRNCYFFPSNDVSVRTENNPVKLPQGCPSNSIFADCTFWGGLRMSDCGDSNNIERCVIRSAANTKAGLEINVIAGEFGSAGHTVLFANNIDCYGGAVLARACRHFQLLSNNIEQSTGTGASLGAVVALLGDILQLDNPVIRDNHISVFGTSTAQRAIYVAAARRADIHGNKCDTDVGRTEAVWVGAAAVTTLFGVNELTAAWTAKVTNEGTGTRSITVASGYTPS